LFHLLRNERSGKKFKHIKEFFMRMLHVISAAVGFAGLVAFSAMTQATPANMSPVEQSQTPKVETVRFCRSMCVGGWRYVPTWRGCRPVRCWSGPVHNPRISRLEYYKQKYPRVDCPQCGSRGRPGGINERIR
jgi:hypothetical protein